MPISLSVTEHVADVRLDRADKMNALDPAMFAAIADAIATLADTAGLRAVVLSGEGSAFCAGLDMVSMASGLGVGPGGGQDLGARTHGDANIFQHIAWGWRTLAVPVIVAVHGVAFGGGFQIMAGADIRIAHPATRMSIMEIKWGLVPDMGGIALWRTLVRDDVLRELTYTGREFSGEEAARLGFVTRLADDPLTEAMALAREIAGKSPDAVRGAKLLYNFAADGDGPQILAHETEEQMALLGSVNQIEAVTANMEKRVPDFRG